MSCCHMLSLMEIGCLVRFAGGGYGFAKRAKCPHRGLKELYGCGSLHKDPPTTEMNPYESPMNPYEFPMNPYESV